MKQVLITLYLSLFLITGLHSQTDQLFTTANAAYKQQDYTKAISSYQEILASGQVSPELYYNLGNAYLKAKQVGPAILNYERALRLKPSDKSIQQNLEVAREEVATPITEIPEFFMVRIWKGLSGLFSPTLWMILQFLLGLGFLYGIYLWRIVAEEDKKLKGFMLMLFSLAILLLAYLAGRSAHYQDTRKDTAIVITSDSLRSGPDGRSDEIEPLSSGVKVFILDKIDDWYKVSLVNKEQGWIQAEVVELI